MKKWIVESPLRYSNKMAMVGHLSLLNDWRKQNRDIPYFEKRLELYDYLSAKILGAKPITYLEFGVYRGDSIRYWAGLNGNPESRFVGFDTFEGLPEKWEIYTGTLDRGHFQTGGELPKIADQRVSFHKGLFQETLPGFLASFRSQNQLVINNDSDLYSSTLFTLCSLHPYMRPGTIVIFDEFSQVLDEFRALQDYTKSFMRNHEVLGAAGQYYDRVAIRFTK
jgi:O-methyltransferase